MEGAEPKGRFVRVLGRLDILTLSFGAMIGWGWVILSDDWILDGGSLGAMLAFGLGGVVVLLVGLTYSELTSAMPKVGGEHVFSYRALGVGASFVCTWSIILGYVAVCAFEAVAITSVTDALLPGLKRGLLWNVAGSDVHATLVAAGMIGTVIIGFVNYIGVKPAAFLQTIFTASIALGGVLLIAGSVFSPEASLEKMRPFFHETGVEGIFAVLVMTPFMFVGFDIIPQAAEEIALPYRQIGRILMFSVALAVAWYLLIILGVSRALDPAALRGSEGVATAEAMEALYGGSWAATLLLVAGFAGIMTSWNSFYLAGTRAIYAMAHSRMLPGFLAKLHPKHKTPTNAILLVGLMTLPAPLFGRKMLVWLVDAGGFAIVVAWVMVSLSFLVLRRREPEMARPFRVRWGALVGAASLVLSIGLVLLYFPLGIGSAALVRNEWLIVLGWAVLGAVFYVYSLKVYGRQSMVGVMQGQIVPEEKG